MQNRSIIRSLALAALGCCPVISMAADNEPIGRVTAAFGTARADTAAGARTLDIQSLINNDERIITEGGGVTVLLASRVVLKVDAGSAVSVVESPSQTNINVERGTVQVFVGQRPANAGMVCLKDKNGCIEAPTGVFVASYDPISKESYFACEHSEIKLHAGNEDGPVTAMSGDQQALLKGGQLVSTGPLDRVAFNERKRSLDRIDQTQVTRGADTFRLRSRALDTESAISQLSAAGWIDRTTLPGGTSVASSSSGGNAPGEVQTGKPQNKNGSSSAAASGGGSANSSNSVASITRTDGATAKSSAAPAGTASVAPAAPAVDLGASQTTPVVTVPVVEQAVVPLAPPKPSVALTPTVPEIDLGTAVTPKDASPSITLDAGKSIAAQTTPAPAAIDLGLNTPIITPHITPAVDLGSAASSAVAKPAGISVPKVDVVVGGTGATASVPKTTEVTTVTSVKDSAPASIAPPMGATVNSPIVSAPVAAAPVIAPPPVTIAAPAVAPPPVIAAPPIAPPPVTIAAPAIAPPPVIAAPAIAPPPVTIAAPAIAPPPIIAPPVTTVVPTPVDLGITGATSTTLAPTAAVVPSPTISAPTVEVKVDVAAPLPTNTTPTATPLTSATPTVTLPSADEVTGAVDTSKAALDTVTKLSNATKGKTKDTTATDKPGK